MSTTVLKQYVIYDHPKDHPNHWVVREWRITSGFARPIPGRSWLAPSLESAREAIPEGRVNLGRMAGDDAAIYEVWT